MNSSNDRLLRSGESPEALDTPEPRGVGIAFGHGYAPGAQPGTDRLQRFRVIELPAQRGDVLGRTVEDDQPATVRVHPKCHGVVRSRVEVQPQAVHAEAPPGVVALRFDQHVPEADSPEDVGDHG